MRVHWTMITDKVKYKRVEAGDTLTFVCYSHDEKQADTYNRSRLYNTPYKMHVCNNLNVNYRDLYTCNICLNFNEKNSFLYDPSSIR